MLCVGLQSAGSFPRMTTANDAPEPGRRGLLLAAGAWAALGTTARAAPADVAAELAAIEARAKGRLGVFVTDAGGRTRYGHRADERFPMCSTFKLLLAGVVLTRVDAGQERLDRIVRYGKADLLSTSPVTEAHVAEGGLSVGRLCEGMVQTSDNAAANLLLRRVGGPAEFTRALRSLGDGFTRLDRYELALNEATPGDPRDTTTPSAFAGAVRTLLFERGLSPASRVRLATWMQGTRTGLARLRAATPKGWRAGDKTGTGDRGTTNDVAVFWPPQGAPLIVAAYLTQCDQPLAARQATLAAVGKLAVASAKG